MLKVKRNRFSFVLSEINGETFEYKGIYMLEIKHKHLVEIVFIKEEADQFSVNYVSSKTLNFHVSFNNDQQNY